MPRPPLPITPDSFEAFVQHASENLYAWFEYIQQCIAYEETIELQVIYIQEQSQKNQIDLQTTRSIKEYQSQLISEL